jgi:hypothetical protein
MDTDDKVELAAKIMPAVTPLAKVFAEEKLNERAMRRRKDAELEVIEAKNKAGGGTFGSFGQTAATESPEADVVEQQSQSEFEDSIDGLIADEDCELCSQLLEGIKDISPQKRPQALAEYGRFKQSTADTDDVEEIRAEIEEMGVLREVMLQEFNMAPS